MNIQKLAKYHNALSNEIRLKILSLLLEKIEECICNLSSELEKDQSVIFRHIKLLEENHFIKTEKKGSSLFCSIVNDKKVRRILKWE